MIQVSYLAEVRGARRAAAFTCAGVFYEQGMLNEAIQSYQDAIAREPNFPEAYNNLGNALREANRMEEAMQCYTMCIQLQLRSPVSAMPGRSAQVSSQAAAFQQAQRLSVTYNNLGGILKMQVNSRSPYTCTSLQSLCSAACSR